MDFNETIKKWQKLSRRLTIIGFALAAVVCIITLVALGVSLNNKKIDVTVAVAVACVIVFVVICALFVMCFLMNRINSKYVAQAKAAEEEANKAKTEFLTKTSHDVRTPLNSIMGMSSIAIANINDAKLVENCLKKISVSSRQLMELVNELSDIPVTESDETPLNFAEAQEGQPGENGQKAKEVDLKGKRILVAEDNDLNWEIAELLLTSEGFEVEHAENGQTCVDMLLAHKAGYYDAILMDVRMPVMSGLEATTVIRGLKKAYRGIPIIAMTADAFAEDMQKCLECGMNAHIAKPIDIEVVKSTLAKYIIKKD